MLDEYGEFYTNKPEPAAADDYIEFPALPGEQEFLDLVLRLRPLGFGRMMQIISYAWHEIDPVGALSTGPCYGLLPEKDLEYEESIKRSDPLDYSKAKQGGA